MESTGRGLAGALLLGTLWMAACSGGAVPSGPSAIGPRVDGATGSTLAAGTTLTVVSGESEEPVANALVTVAGTPYRTNARGEVTLGAVVAGSVVDIVSARFMPRQTLLRGADQTRFSLWPAASATGLDESLTRQLVYTEAYAGAPLGTAPLHRLSPAIHHVTLALPDRYRADAEIAAAFVAATERLTAASGGRITFSVGTEGVVEIAVDPGAVPEGAAAATYRTFDGDGYVVSARIAYRSADLMRISALDTHELGHVYGLNHSMRPGIMAATAVLYGYGDFTDEEKLVMSLMGQRRATNVFPDDDRRLSLSSTSRGDVAVCRY